MEEPLPEEPPLEEPLDDPPLEPLEDPLLAAGALLAELSLDDAAGLLSPELADSLLPLSGFVDE